VLLRVDLEDLGGGAQMAVAEPVHDERIIPPFRQAFHGGWQGRGGCR
jgi:hypothetical protein